MENAICILATSYPYACPILALDLIEDSQIAYLSAEWVTVPYHSGLSLKFTKTDSEEAPLTNTSFGPPPCLHSHQFNGQGKKILYPLENRDSNECLATISGYPVYDERYKAL